MIRLHMIVEGQTEETFVNQILVNHCGRFNISIDVRSVETSRHRSRTDQSTRIYRGGLLDYQRAKRDLERWMREDQNSDAFFSTMFDLYALPDDFPNYANARRLGDPYRRIETLEAAFKADLGHLRFIPYIQLHEFEALLLADPEKFDWEFLEHDQPIRQLIQMAAGFASPELINDNPETAPSKRIIQLIPEYAGRKSSAGPLIAAKIGLAVLRAKCPHFDSWLQHIEALGKSQATDTPQ